jgi:hypothetical protein
MCAGCWAVGQQSYVQSRARLHVRVCVHTRPSGVAVGSVSAGHQAVCESADVFVTDAVAFSCVEPLSAC